MALKFTLKPDEKIIINQAVIVNGKHKTEFHLENHCAVLRLKDLLSEKEATSPCRILYYMIQMHYLADDNDTQRLAKILESISNIKQAAPSLGSLLQPVLDYIEAKNYYKALKDCAPLIQQEDEIFKHAS